MINLLLDRKKDERLHVLCLGAHSDDLEIGCGGAILRLIKEYPHLEITWVVFGAYGHRAEEATSSAHLMLGEVKQKQVILKNFRDGFFPYIGKEIKEEFEALKSIVSPDLIFSHYGDDAHQDHRLISELTWNTFRDHFILEYEIPKYDGDFGKPNFFVMLEDEFWKKKIFHLSTQFESQRNKPWFTAETFTAIMRLRGIEARAPSGYAEAYYCRKIRI